MEPDRVEMSVGSGMVNGDRPVNGVAVNGSTINPKSQPDTTTSNRPTKPLGGTHTNGDIVSIPKGENGGPQPAPNVDLLHDVPPELLQALSSEFYLPMATLVSRSAQACWNDLSKLVERLASMPVSTQQSSNAGASINDQSKVNLEKKDLLLNFAKDHKDVFIKLLVLLQWSRKSSEVRKTIELNLWLQQRRQAFNNATGMLGNMIRGLADAQVPNPDLYTAGEVLATGNVSSMPKLEYIPQPDQTPEQTIHLLKRLDTILCTRMALAEDIPTQLQTYSIHDGRVSFIVADEFSFDVSVQSEDSQAKFGMVDFGFLFDPAPSIPDALHDEIIYITNTALVKDGLTGVYDFLHDLALSNKLSELAKQARSLAQGLWNGHLRVELIRRTLAVQYWLKGSTAKSWFEIGIHSGKGQNGSSATILVPELRLRWFREGKLTDSSEVYINPARISFDEILRQILAQHTNYLFDAIYDKLMSTPLYNTAQLDLDQSSSTEDPAECYLEVQLSKADTLLVKMEPIAGTLILSPASERTNRAQFDLARSKNVVDDFVSRVSSLRSDAAETNLFKSLPNSSWQRLEGIKLSPAETEKLFGRSITRVSFIRLPEWTAEWLVAVTQSAAGDLWWLIQCLQPNTLAGSRTMRLVANHPLYRFGVPAPAYLERLADHTTGVVSLQSNAESLHTRRLTWRLSDIMTFDDESRLPALEFSRIPASATSESKSRLHTADKKELNLQADSASYVSLTYNGIDRVSKQVIMIAKSALTANPAVLRDLAALRLNNSVSIFPESKKLMIKVKSRAGSSVVEDLISKLSHLENVIACTAAVKKSSDHSLQSLSLSSITIRYHTQPDLSLRIGFGMGTSNLSADFLPAESNPQRYLSQWVVRTMQSQGHDSSQKLAKVFVVLKMTRPILSQLTEIQSLQEKEKDTTNNPLRVHVLHRQPTAYGLQYFANSSNFKRDESELGTPKKLLARFEILALKRGTKLMWMIRPAIEEFHSYNRPSYTSKDLRGKLEQEVFKKQTSLWLPLDGGAACPSETPEQLLSAIHTTILAWAKEAVKPEAAIQSNSGSAIGARNDGATDNKSQRPTPSTQKSQNTQQRPNGVQRPQQFNGQTNSQNFKNKNQGSKPSEVITLD